MKVTDDMTTDSGSPLNKLADFIDVDNQGVQVTREGDLVAICVDSTCTTGKRCWLDVADAEGVIGMLTGIVAEIRELYG